MSTHGGTVVVDGRRVGIFWPARGGGYTLRTGTSLSRPKVHHFSRTEGLPGLMTYIKERYGAMPELIPAESET